MKIYNKGLRPKVRQSEKDFVYFYKRVACKIFILLFPGSKAGVQSREVGRGGNRLKRKNPIILRMSAQVLWRQALLLQKEKIQLKMCSSINRRSESFASGKRKVKIRFCKKFFQSNHIWVWSLEKIRFLFTPTLCLPLLPQITCKATGWFNLLSMRWSLSVVMDR